MQTTNTLPPSLFAVLLEQAAAGNVSTFSLLSNVQNNQLVSWKTYGAKFVKQGPGNFTVTMYRDGQQQGQSLATSPTEAKGLVLEYLIGRIKEEQRQGATA